MCENITAPQREVLELMTIGKTIFLAPGETLAWAEQDGRQIPLRARTVRALIQKGYLVKEKTDRGFVCRTPA